MALGGVVSVLVWAGHTWWIQLITSDAEAEGIPRMEGPEGEGPNNRNDPLVIPNMAIHSYMITGNKWLVVWNILIMFSIYWE